MVRGFPGARARSEGRKDAAETIDLIRRYVVQETITPLKHLGRTLAYGILGAIGLGIGVLFLLVAGLRALETETGSTFAGSWSFAPFLLMSGAAAVSITAIFGFWHHAARGK
jgi:hypothetical protein